DNITCDCTYHSFFFQAEDGIRDRNVTGVQTCLFRSRPRAFRSSPVRVPGRGPILLVPRSVARADTWPWPARKLPRSLRVRSPWMTASSWPSPTISSSLWLVSTEFPMESSASRPLRRVVEWLSFNSFFFPLPTFLSRRKNSYTTAIRQPCEEAARLNFPLEIPSRGLFAGLSNGFRLTLFSFHCRLSSVEAYLDIGPLLQVHRIDEPHLPLVQGQNQRTGAHTFSEKSHPLQQISVRHARTRKHHLSAWRQVFRVINAFRVLHSDFPKP